MTVESPELESSVEWEPDELDRIQLEVVAKLQERGININYAHWRNLIPSVRLGDLNSGQEDKDALEYRPKDVYAQVGSDGRVTLDRKEFANLGEFQKQHTLLHEAGHRLDWLLSDTNNEHWQEAGEIIGSMEPNEVSSYIHHLTEKYQDAEPEVLAKIIRQEALPELIAQFVESDGSFKGFVEARMQSGAGQEGSAAWAGISEVETVLAQLERFESMSDQEKEKFFDDNPRLQNRFRVFVSLGEVLQDADLIESVTDQWDDDYENDFSDELAMVSELAPEPPKVLRAPAKKVMPPKKPGWFDLFWIFRKD